MAINLYNCFINGPLKLRHVTYIRISQGAYKLKCGKTLIKHSLQRIKINVFGNLSVIISKKLEWDFFSLMKQAKNWDVFTPKVTACWVFFCPLFLATVEVLTKLNCKSSENFLLCVKRTTFKFIRYPEQNAAQKMLILLPVKKLFLGNRHTTFRVFLFFFKNTIRFQTEMRTIFKVFKFISFNISLYY